MPPIAILVALTLSATAAAIVAAQSVQAIAIRVDGRARVGFPIWLHADLQGALTVRYPFGGDPRYFGSNQLELKRDGQTLLPLPGYSSGGLVGLVAGSIAPPDSPQNRLPLHLGFVIDRPGRYSVRWTVMGGGVDPGPPPSRHEQLLAQSDWLDFDVIAPPPTAQQTWLAELLGAPPTEAGAFVGDYLPSLLAAAPDSRVVQTVMDATYSPVELIASCALGTLRLFPAEVAMPLTLRTLERRGPSGSLAYFVSSHAAWFQDNREEVVRMAISFLTSNDDAIVIGALTVLNFARHFDWPNEAPLREADHAVKAAASTLMTRSDRVAHQLAVTLGGTRDPDVRDLLNQIAAQHPSTREQVTIALRWLADSNSPTHSRSSSPALREAREALIRLKSADPSTRKAGAHALLDLAHQGPSQMQSIGAYLLNDVIRTPGRVNAETWRDATLMLGRLRSPLTAALTVYLERDGVAAALIETGEPAVPAVNDVLKVGGPIRRRLAAQVLGAIGGAAARDALSAALKQESDPAVKRAIETALSRLGQRPLPAEIR